MTTRFAFISALLAASALGQNYTINTFAGGGLPATPAAATTVPLYARGLTLDSAGNLYILTSSAVFKMDSTGTLRWLAGAPGGGALGDNGPATSANISASLGGIAIDSAGNIYIAESENNRIRKITPGGTISTVAGTGVPGYSGDNGPAINAQLSMPMAVCVDPSGNLYVADASNNRVRKISPTGVITTYAGTGGAGSLGDGGPAVNAQLNSPRRLALDAAGSLYIADRMNAKVRKVTAAGIISTYAGTGHTGYSGDGGPAGSAMINAPAGLSVDGYGNLYIADDNSFRIRKVSPGGNITTVAGTGTYGTSGDGGLATLATLCYLADVVSDPSGVLYIADSSKRVRKVASNGTINTVAGIGANSGGDGGPATSAMISYPEDAVMDSAGNVYISEYGYSRIRKVAPSGIISTFAGDGTYASTGDGGPAANAEFSSPYGLATDSNGNLYIVEYGGHRIRKVNSAGIVSTFAGTGAAGFSGDGGQAASAQLNYPMAVAVDANLNVYIADTNNYRIRRVTPGGVISTVVGTGAAGYSGDGGLAVNAKINSPHGMTFDSSGNLYFADMYNSCVRMVSPAGIISTAAGTCGSSGYAGDGAAATSAKLNYPVDVAIDGGGNLFIVDGSNYCIREVTGGIISTVAGSGLEGYQGDGGPATSARLFSPNSVTAGSNGRIYIADTLANAVRVLSAFGVSPGGLVNSASYTSPVAPGSIVAVFGDYALPSNFFATQFPAPTSLGGLSFQVGSTAAIPLFYAGATQSNAQLPWELSGQLQTTVTASKGSLVGATQTVHLAQYAPGIYTTNGQGTGQGAIQNAAFQLVDTSHPVAAGTDYIVIYCTGLGPVTNQPATGAPAPGVMPLSETTTKPQVTIGGVQTTAAWAGLTPDTAGLYQVNVQVPAGSAKGNAVPVTITIGGVTSNTATIAVR